MKILFCNMLDPNYVKGHKNLDMKMIHALSKFSCVTIISPKEWYISLPDNVNVVFIDSMDRKSGRSKHYMYGVSVINRICELDRTQRFNYIFLGSYDTYLMTWGMLRIKKSSQRVFILQHNNIDIIDHHIKPRLFYNMYAKKVHHVVLGEFIRQHLIDNHHISNENVINIPHPIVNAPEKIDYSKKIYDCIAISNSNDEKWVRDIINLENSEKFFSINRLKVVFRSKIYSFDGEWLKVINGFMPIEEYQNYYRGAKIIFLPFPSTYEYRMSASLVDAVTNGSIALCTRIPLIEYYSEKYPMICKMIDNVDDLKKALLNIDVTSIKPFVDEFVNNHNDDVTLDVLKKTFS